MFPVALRPTNRCPSRSRSASVTWKANKCPRHASAARGTTYTSLAATAAAAAAAATDAYEELRTHTGVESTLVAVGQTPLGRGLVAQAAAGRQALLSVPTTNALIIADEPLSGLSIYSDRHLAAWQQQHGAMPEDLVDFLQGDARWDVRMCAWLLWVTRHPGQLWRSYCRLLPVKGEPSCLLNFDQEAIRELQLPELQKEAQVQVTWARYIHDRYLSSSSGQLAGLALSSSLEDTLWAVAMVRSRTFSEDVEGEVVTLMVPFADLANHADENNATFCLNKKQRRFELRSLRPLEAGEEVTISYGESKPNCQLLRDYGFVVPGNVWDRVALTGASPEAQGGQSSGRVQPDLHLNPINLLEAAGFTGDLLQGTITPAHPPKPQQATRWRRRTAALLSLPVLGPPSAAAHWSSESTQQLRERAAVGQQRASGVLSWFDELARPWTPSGQAAAIPLQPQQLAGEWQRVAALQQQVLQQLQQLPTSISYDEELLEVPAGGGDTGPLPVDPGHLGDTNVVNSAAAAAAGQLQQAGKQSSRVWTPQQRAAVEMRLEHKLLLKETLAVLMMYEQHLGGRMV